MYGGGGWNSGGWNNNRRNITYGPRYSMSNITQNNGRSAVNFGGRRTISGSTWRQTQSGNNNQRGQVYRDNNLGGTQNRSLNGRGEMNQNNSSQRPRESRFINGSSNDQRFDNSIGNRQQAGDMPNQNYRSNREGNNGQMDRTNNPFGERNYNQPSSPSPRNQYENGRINRQQSSEIPNQGYRNIGEGRNEQIDRSNNSFGERNYSQPSSPSPRPEFDNRRGNREESSDRLQQGYRRNGAARNEQIDRSSNSFGERNYSQPSSPSPRPEFDNRRGNREESSDRLNQDYRNNREGRNQQMDRTNNSFGERNYSQPSSPSPRPEFENRRGNWEESSDRPNQGFRRNREDNNGQRDRTNNSFGERNYSQPSSPSPRPQFENRSFERSVQPSAPQQRYAPPVNNGGGYRATPSGGGGSFRGGPSGGGGGSRGGFGGGGRR
jgi:hypothetical protein